MLRPHKTDASPPWEHRFDTIKTLFWYHKNTAWHQRHHQEEECSSVQALAPISREGYGLPVISDLLQGAALVAVRTLCCNYGFINGRLQGAMMYYNVCWLRTATRAAPCKPSHEHDVRMNDNEVKHGHWSLRRYFLFLLWRQLVAHFLDLYQP